MFTGLVQTLGLIVELIPQPPGIRMVIEAPSIAETARLGDSICVSGCCLTVVACEGARLTFEMGEETLRRTTLGARVAGDAVNLEASLRVGDPLGGHFVTGHVDGVGRLVQRLDCGDWSDCWFEASSALLLQMAEKGSIAVDGVSLTLVHVEPGRFSVALIPHTLSVTTLGRLQVGDPVNLETDVLAKYVQRQLAGRTETPETGPS